MDAFGNLYGTTLCGGTGDCEDARGTVFKLTPPDGGWTYTLLHDFTGGTDGALPLSTVLTDAQAICTVRLRLVAHGLVMAAAELSSNWLPAIT